MSNQIKHILLVIRIRVRPWDIFYRFYFCFVSKGFFQYFILLILILKVNTWSFIATTVSSICRWRSKDNIHPVHIIQFNIDILFIRQFFRRFTTTSTNSSRSSISQRVSTILIIRAREIPFWFQKMQANKCVTCKRQTAEPCKFEFPLCCQLLAVWRVCQYEQGLLWSQELSRMLELTKMQTIPNYLINQQLITIIFVFEKQHHIFCP